MSYQVNLKSWIAGSGWQYTTPIESINEYISAADYIAACNENMDITPWERPDDGEAFYIEITDADGVPLSGAWTSGDTRAKSSIIAYIGTIFDDIQGKN